MFGMHFHDLSYTTLFRVAFCFFISFLNNVMKTVIAKFQRTITTNRENMFRIVNYKLNINDMP